MLSLVVGVLSLSACGGGSGGGQSGTVTPVTATVSAAPSSVTLGKSFIVSGTGLSHPSAMSSMTWTATTLTSGSATLTVSNGDCASATKSSQTINSITQSTWTCDAVITVPSVLAQDTSYRITLTATDSAGNASSSNSDITVSAGNSGALSQLPTVTTTSAVTVTAGNDVGLNCTASGGVLATGSGYTYNWVATSNPTGLPLSLTVAQDGSVAFKAPAVKTTSAITLQCRALDTNSQLATADVVLTINPTTATTPIASAGSDQTVAMGTTVTLNASASSTADGSPLYYAWKQIGGPVVTLSSSTNVAPTFVAPVVTDTTALTFQVVAQPTSPATFVGASASEVATVTVYVTPQTPLTLKISPAQVTTGNTAISLQATASPATSTLYYAWSQVSGPTVTLAGDNTATASFISPVVSGSRTDLVFNVLVSRKPIAQSQPADLVSADTIVGVTP